MFSNMSGIKDDFTVDATHELEKSCALSILRLFHELTLLQTLQPISKRFDSVSKLSWLEGDRPQAKHFKICDCCKEIADLTQSEPLTYPTTRSDRTKTRITSWGLSAMVSCELGGTIAGLQKPASA